MDLQGVFPTLALCTCWVSFQHLHYARAGCLSTTNNMNVLGVFPSLACSMDVQDVFYHKQYGGCTHFHHRTFFLNAGLPAVRNLVSPVPDKGDPVSYRNAPVSDWDVGCRNTDAGGISLDTPAKLRFSYKSYSYNLASLCFQKKKSKIFAFKK